MAFTTVQVSVRSVSFSSVELEWTCSLQAQLYHLAVLQGGTRMEVTVPGTVKAFEVTRLSPGQLYTVQVAPEVRGRQLSWSKPMVVQTKSHPHFDLLVRSERLVTEESHESREVLMGRRAHDWKDYTFSSFKFARPASHREVRMKRSMLLSTALDLMNNEGYAQDDDYFQGPLYKDNY